MATKRSKAPPKRGRGRPPVPADAKLEALTIRLRQADIDDLKARAAETEQTPGAIVAELLAKSR